MRQIKRLVGFGDREIVLVLGGYQFMRGPKVRHLRYKRIVIVIKLHRFLVSFTYPDRRISNSDSFVNSFTMVVSQNLVSKSDHKKFSFITMIKLISISQNRLFFPQGNTGSHQHRWRWECVRVLPKICQFNTYSRNINFFYIINRVYPKKSRCAFQKLHVKKC